MKTLKLLAIIFIGLAIGCHDESDLNIIEKQDYTSRIASNISDHMPFTEVPLEIAEEIAIKYPNYSHGLFSENENMVQREIKETHTLMDKNGIPALYLTTYKDDLGYIIISAEWEHEPICAVVKQGTYPDLEAPSMLIEWMEVTIQNIELIRYYGYDNAEKARSAWALIDGDLDISAFEIPPKGGGGDPCGDWKYKTVGPLMSTTWGQHCSFNNRCDEDDCNGSPLHCPDNCSNNPLTGCVATAMAQVIRYWEAPSSHGYNYSSMPNNRGNNEVQRLMYDAGCSVDMDWGCNSSGAYGDKIPGALKNEFAFSSAKQSTYGLKSHETIVENLDKSRPVLMDGCRSKNTFAGITYQYTDCHEWVCDGYQQKSNDCYSYLKFHMNWGWGPRGHTGWFAYNHWTKPGVNVNFKYAGTFTHDIHL